MIVTLLVLVLAAAIVTVMIWVMRGANDGRPNPRHCRRAGDPGRIAA